MIINLRPDEDEWFLYTKALRVVGLQYMYLEYVQ